MYHLKLRSIFAFIFIITITSCSPTFVDIPTETILPTATFLPFSPTSTNIPYTSTINTATVSPDTVFTCENSKSTSLMTEEQLTAILNHDYNFIYTSDNKSSENIYSINRADTLCAGEKGSAVGKIVSGFVVSVDQPSGEAYSQQGVVTSRYLQVRFFDIHGKEHDYWLQFSGLTPQLDQFQIVSWENPISNEENVFEIFLHVKNSDGTESIANVSDILTNQLIKANDQFIAIIYVGNYDGEKINTTDSLFQFIQAVEGKASFPSPSDVFILQAGALLVPGHP